MDRQSWRGGRQDDTKNDESLCCIAFFGSPGYRVGDQKSISNDSYSKLVYWRPKAGVSDLAQAIRDGVLYEGGDAVVKPRLISLTLQFAFAIEYMHSRGVVHQDLKPANIFCNIATSPRTGSNTAADADADAIKAARISCLIGDFGLSRIIKDHTEMNISATYTANVGSPAYSE